MGNESILLQEDNQRNPELVLGMINALQDLERDEYYRLEAIKRELRDGKTIPKYEIRRLISISEKLQKESEYQKKVQWTLDVIKQLQQAEMGIFERLNEIQNRLEEGETLHEDEINYLKINWKLLRTIEK
jgi:hypothetical protein